jgi:hypothetical protein
MHLIRSRPGPFPARNSRQTCAVADKPQPPPGAGRRIASRTVGAAGDAGTHGELPKMLQARHAALSKAVSGAGQQSRPSASAVPGYRTDAIVAILDAAGAEMSINDVLAALCQAGRGHETYDNVGVDLAYLTERGRITRVRRGIYASASG